MSWFKLPNNHCPRFYRRSYDCLGDGEFNNLCAWRIVCSPLLALQWVLCPFTIIRRTELHTEQDTTEWVSYDSKIEAITCCTVRSKGAPFGCQGTRPVACWTPGLTTWSRVLVCGLWDRWKWCSNSVMLPRRYCTSSFASSACRVVPCNLLQKIAPMRESRRIKILDHINACDVYRKLKVLPNLTWMHTAKTCQESIWIQGQSLAIKK